LTERPYPALRAELVEPPPPAAATVRLPRSLIALFPGCPAEIMVSGPTLLEAIDDLDRQVPGIRNRLLDAGPEIRSHLNLFVDGDLAGLSTVIWPGAVIRVVPAVSGG
jgi:molybdopterin synthase sulfur carrier subunit